MDWRHADWAPDNIRLIVGDCAWEARVRVGVWQGAMCVL